MAGELGLPEEIEDTPQFIGRDLTKIIAVCTGCQYTCAFAKLGPTP